MCITCKPMSNTNVALSNGTSMGLGLGAPTTFQEDVEHYMPRAGRTLELPFNGRVPVPDNDVAKPKEGFVTVVTLEDQLYDWELRNTKGLNGGGRSNDDTDRMEEYYQYEYFHEEPVAEHMSRLDDHLIEQDDTVMV